MIPSKKELEMLLSAIKGFEKPKPELEQYITPSDTAAELLWIAFMNGNIKNKIIADLGSGTGILSFGAALLGAKSVTGYEIDPLAIAVAKENDVLLEKTGIPMCKVGFVVQDIKEIKQKFDTVVMNPPFGVQKRGADQIFLKKAFEITNIVYSIHKLETGEFLQKFAESKEFSATLLGTAEIKLPPTMKFHEKRKHGVNVGIWRFVRHGA